MIKVLDKAEDRVKLHFIEDDSEDVTGIKRDQWIQWLVSQTMNQSMKIWANIDEENKITSYIVVYDCVDRPVSDHVYVPYFWADRDSVVNMSILEEVKKWARMVGADSIQAAAIEPEDFLACGFLKSPEVIVELSV